MTRDTLKSRLWFDQWVQASLSDIAARLEIRRMPAANPAYEPFYARDLGFRYFKLMMRLYSGGAPVTQLYPYFEPLLGHWEEAERLGNAIWSPEQHQILHAWSTNLDFYIECFWVVGLALALDVPESQWQRLLTLVGNEGEDALLDRVIASRQPSRRIGASLCYPKPYAKLQSALDAKGRKQQKLLQEFVDDWYLGLAKAAKSGRDPQAVPHAQPYWYECHTADGGYFGYWCLEAVAAVKALGLNDSLCIAHPHYPGDLLRAGVCTPSDPLRLPPGLDAAMARHGAAALAGSLCPSRWAIFRRFVANRFGL